MTSELAAIQQFLTGHRIEGVETNLIHDLFDPHGNGVRSMLLRNQNDFLLILVNEDNHHRLGVDVYGLGAINHRKLYQLYGEEQVDVIDGNMVTRMQPYEVKLFSTRQDSYETLSREGRDFVK